MSARRATVAGRTIVLSLAVVGFLAPLIANDRPLLATIGGHLALPAAGELALVGPLFERPGWANRAWNRPAPGDRWQLRAPIPHSFRQTDLGARLAPPSAAHWLGTDNLGRDQAARILHGTATSLQVGVISTLLALVVGLLLGGLAGYFGGAVDFAVSRAIEVMLAFPTFFLILGVLAFLPPSMPLLFAVIGLTRWPFLARYARGEVMRLRQQGFVEAARSAGAGRLRVVWRHVLPHAMTPVLVAATFQMAGAMLVEAGLSFLGFGVPEPFPSWGGLLSQAHGTGHWWLVLFPGLALTAAVTGIQLMGEGFRDALDPRVARL